MEPGHDAARCDGALARAFGFLGKRWSGVLLGTLLHGPMSYTELRRAVPGISESVLADRLSELGRANLVRREVREGPPVGVIYELTSGGQALVPVLHQLAGWAREHLPVEECANSRAS